jgi:hypothetical protein
MIFSLSNDGILERYSELSSDSHVYCFFRTHDGIYLPASEWWRGILSSLRMKKNVLILEKSQVSPAKLGSQRWLVGADFLWLAPRSYSVLFKALNEFSIDYHSIKVYLSNCK